MASLTEVVRALSRHIYCVDDRNKPYNDLRIRSIELTKFGSNGEEPLIQTVGRGKYYKQVSAEDCALLLIAILVNDKAHGVGDIVRKVKDLKVVDIKEEDQNLYKISVMTGKEIQDVTLLDCLTSIIEDQAFGREDLDIVTTLMSAQYKKLENQSLGFYFSIDWFTEKLSSYSAINKVDNKTLKRIKHEHSLSESDIGKNLFPSSFTSFGNSTQSIIQNLSSLNESMPNNRYAKIKSVDQILQKSPSYVRKVKIGGDVISILAELIQHHYDTEKMMAHEMAAPMDFDNFDEFILQKILFHLMNVNIRSFAELNTKTPEFLLMYEEINEYFNLKGLSPLRIGSIQDIRKRFNDLDRGKKDHNEILNRVYERFRYNKELLQQTLTGSKKEAP